MIISNATPLIYLGKLKRLDLLHKVYGTIIIPKEVFEEVVVKGKKLNKKEVILIEKCITDRKLIVKTSLDLSKTLSSLHRGEAHALNICLQEKIKDIILDDKEAYELCKVLDLKPMRATAFLLFCVKKKLITVEDFKESLVFLSKEGYYMSAEVFQCLLDAVDKHN